MQYEAADPADPWPIDAGPAVTTSVTRVVSVCQKRLAEDIADVQTRRRGPTMPEDAADFLGHVYADDHGGDNRAKAGVDWRFTTADARVRLKRL